jgi:PAS domain S-box-containing protein
MNASSELRLLLVEDSEQDATLLLRELGQGLPNIRPRRVQTREEFVAALSEASWDLIISDHHLPSFDSTEALKLLKASELDIPFVIVSGSIGEENAVAVLKAGAHDYVPKHSLRRLVPAIERELRDCAIRKEARRAQEALRESERRLRKSERRFQDLFEFAPDAIVMADELGTIVQVNTQAEALFRVRREALVGLALAQLLPGHDSIWPAKEPSESEPTNPLAREERCALQTVRLDGSRFPADVRVGVIHSESGLSVAVALRDATLRLEAEEELRQSLAEKNTLLKELHHRVKNNLQIISSLLAMRSSRTDDAKAREVLEESIHRVGTIALLHEVLQQSEGLARVDFGAYALTLATHLIRASGGNIELRHEIEPVELNIETAMPCGLILNELVSNSLKHAAPHGAAVLHLRVSREPAGAFSLTLRDSGPGLPPGLKLEEATSMGLQLVRSLARQVKAELEQSNEVGACFRLTCQEVVYARR